MTKPRYDTEREGQLARLRPSIDRRLGRMQDCRELRAQNLSDRQIAERMDVSVRTVERYRDIERRAEADVTRVMRLLREDGLWPSE